MFFTYTLIIILSIYFLSLLVYIIGNFQNNHSSITNHLESVSVIVAVKNGESSLINLLTDLQNQDYNGDIEYIIVDDQSIDNTKKIITTFIKQNNSFKYVSSIEGNPKLFFKKRALDAGIKKARFNI